MYTHIYISIGIDLQGYPCMEIQYSHIYICIHPIQKSTSPKYYFLGIVASAAQRVTSLYRLRLLRALASQCNDPDSSLIAMLEEGVPTGIFSNIPTSHQWQQRQDTLSDTSQDDVQLQQCTGNWTRAERDPALLRSLVDKEIQAGHVATFAGDRAAAAKHHALQNTRTRGTAFGS